MENSTNNKNLNSIEIPVEGSLGLLAYGAQGIKAWRKKRKEVADQKNKNSKK